MMYVVCRETNIIDTDVIIRVSGCGEDRQLELRREIPEDSVKYFKFDPSLPVAKLFVGDACGSQELEDPKRDSSHDRNSFQFSCANNAVSCSFVIEEAKLFCSHVVTTQEEFPRMLLGDLVNRAMFLKLTRQVQQLHTIAGHVLVFGPLPSN